MRGQRHARHRPDPSPAAAHPLGEHLAAAGRPRDAGRHRPARRRGARGARGGPARAPAPRVEDIELVLVTHHHLDHSGLAATIAAPLGRRGRGARSRRRLRRALRRAHRRRPSVLARAHAPPRRARRGHRRQRGLLGLHPPDLRGLRHRRRACATAISIRAGGRDLRVVARPGHSTTDTLFVDDRDALAFVGDHLLAGISSNTEIYPAARARRDAPARTRGVPREPAPDRGDAARPAADRPRRPGDRPRRPRPTALADQHERRCDRIVEGARAAAPRRAYEIARQLWSDESWPSSRCSSSGRCSGTSTCCSTRARQRAGHRRRLAPRPRLLRARRGAHGAATHRQASASRPSQPRTPRRWPPCTTQPTRSPTSRRRPRPVRPDGAGGRRHRRHARPRARDGAWRSPRPAPRSSSSAASREACDEVVAALRAEGAKAAACACHVGHWDELDGLVEERLPRLRSRRRARQQRRASRRCTASSRDVTEELFDKVVAVNLKGPFRLAALVGERMVAAGGGSIINVSSHRRGAADERHRALRRRQGRGERDDRRPGARVRADRARERDHAGPVPDHDLASVGHGPVRGARADLPRCVAPARRRRSSAPRCTSRATPRATPRARSSPSTAARSGAWRAPATAAQT